MKSLNKLLDTAKKDSYDHKKIEKKWQKYWESKKIFRAKDPNKKSGTLQKKFYSLIEFPYPSGDGLHVGHIRSNTAMDIISHKRRREGYNVLYPIGWDAFGLPTENYAIKTGIQPAIVTKNNTNIFRKQLKSLGFTFDWSREINTSDPSYYKWTQWIFLQFFKKGLAYKKKMPINWCPKCLIGLANEEVVDGGCERCGAPVEKKEKEQWMLAITKYADRLDKDLDDVNFLEKIKVQQRNWIGRSEGAEIEFDIIEEEKALFNRPLKKTSSSSVITTIKVFTTRPDTLFGVTYLVVSPDHELAKSINKGKTDINTEIKGIKAINPANKEEIPVWVGDYVLSDYGTGAVMAVPAHDERDWDFAKKYNLKIKKVILPSIVDVKNIPAFIGEGVLVDSGSFSGKDSVSVKKEITEYVGGKWVTKFKLRDWIFSRQRYWGEPIPIIHCENCGTVAVPEKDLPIKLPKVKNYKPTETGESPLAPISKWVNVKCPKCKGRAKRETDTMPNWAGSSWYYLRYIDPKNKKAFASRENLEYFTPVDWYNGGMEHTTLHLLYSRFWHKFLFDLSLVPTSEPYSKRTSHGLILALGGEKMSKSKGNVVNPDGIVENVGADALRLYEMFMGPFDQAISWDENGIVGTRRFLERVWKLKNKINETKGEISTLESVIHKTIKKVAEDIEEMKFNTAVSSLMILVNEFEKQEIISKENYSILLSLLAPFAPHITEELWQKIGNKTSIHTISWPIYDKNKIKETFANIVVQINGKMRGSFEANIGENDDIIKKMALNMPEIRKWMSEKEAKKIIIVKDKLINFVL